MYSLFYLLFTAEHADGGGVQCYSKQSYQSEKRRAPVINLVDKDKDKDDCHLKI